MFASTTIGDWLYAMAASVSAMLLFLVLLVLLGIALVVTRPIEHRREEEKDLND